jgi:AraC-like DNA-binding protein
MAERLFPVLPQRPPRGREYGRRFDELLALSTRTDRWGHLRAIHVIEGMLIELAEARAQSGDEGDASPARAWLAKAIDQLDDRARAESPADYTTIAASVGMAESTFRRRFRAATGVPPHVYVLQCRANAARQLLAETDLPVKQIAHRLGYQDVFFFTRQFRKLTGVPPALYRKSRQG